MTQPERDLGHEADMERLRREQLRAEFSPEDAAEEFKDAEAHRFELEGRAAFIDGYDGGDFFCACNAEHSLEELDWNQCDSCGKDIV